MGGRGRDGIRECGRERGIKDDVEEVHTVTIDYGVDERN